MLAIEPEISQRELASRLGMHASRLVAVIDEMETMGLLVRGSNANDRRSYSLSITPAGQQKLAEVTAVSREHDEAICEALNADERQMLASLLQRIANQQGLTPGVHPGYRNLGGRPGPPSGPSGIPARTKKPRSTS
jgi:DNA-binding MarR family transcriptional regulator